MAMTQAHLDELAAAERKAYFKAWRAANPDKVKAQNEAYWRRRAEKKLAQQQAVQEVGADAIEDGGGL